MKKYYLGIDVGGTAVKIGIVDQEGNIAAKTEAPVNHDGYKTPVIETVVRTAEQFLAERPEKVLGVGVSATGQIDTKRVYVAGTCGNVNGWRYTEIGKHVTERLHLPCSANNDANCMCLGEAWIGAAKGYTDVIGITLGTGVGGGIITGGRILGGIRGIGGEIGHFTTHAIDGELCTCGQRGCWERYASTSALVRRAQKIDHELENGRIIFSRAAEGDETVLKLLDWWTDEIAAGIIGFVHVFNPQIVLIGGGVSTQEELLIAPVRKKVLDHIMLAFVEGLKIERATLGNDAGLVGAVYDFMTTHPEI